MKNLKLILFSLVACNVILMSSCSNTSQNSVAANNSVETTTIINETTTVETKLETTEVIKETTEVVEETTEVVEETTEINEVNVEEESKETTEENEVDNMSESEILVAYFSATGTTKKVAEKIAELTSADIYEIVPKDPYSSADLDWHDNNSRTSIEMNDENARPEIGSSDIDLTKYNTIYLGYPIWWGDAPRIMATFVEKYNFDGKKVIPFCTSGGSGIGRSGSNLSTLAGSGNFVNGERLSSSADTNSIQNFIDSNK